MILFFFKLIVKLMILIKLKVFKKISFVFYLNICQVKRVFFEISLFSKLRWFS